MLGKECTAENHLQGLAVILVVICFGGLSGFMLQPVAARRLGLAQSGAAKEGTRKPMASRIRVGSKGLT